MHNMVRTDFRIHIPWYSKVLQRKCPNSLSPHWNIFHAHWATNLALIYTLTSRNVIDTALSVLNRKIQSSQRAQKWWHAALSEVTSAAAACKYSHMTICVSIAVGFWTAARFILWHHLSTEQLINCEGQSNTRICQAFVHLFNTATSH